MLVVKVKLSASPKATDAELHVAAYNELKLGGGSSKR
jgi:hypothetical protein